MAKVAEDQAKQLDSVTDVVQEQEVDATKAQEAMSALSDNQQNNDSSVGDQIVAVSKDDVDLIVSELEVSQEVAERTLREVAMEQLRDGSDSKNQQHTLVVAALRKLVTS